MKKFKFQLDKIEKKIYSISCIFLIIDQLIKILVISNMKLYETINVIPNFFYIFYIKNEGAAFSMLSGNQIFLIIIGIIALYVLIKYIKDEKEINKFNIIPLAIIIGGIVGNTIDRIIHNSVIDYLSFTIAGYNFPIFNLADIGIVVGAILLIVGIYKGEKKNEKFRSKRIG